jgi:tetratricopeptide (TPR) repeat protein
MVPFERNSSFTGRESELERLRQALSKADRTAKVAITGLGGVGKTQLALELIYRWRAEYKTCSIIWIPVTSKESLGLAYLNAAKQLGIPGCDDDKADVKKLVQNHLSLESAGQWLLVFDNADDMDMWIDRSAPNSSRLIDFLPKSTRGSILFTTRDKRAAVKFAGRNIIELSEMDEEGGEQLLRSHLVDHDLLGNHGDMTALLTQLTCLPLAIVQAAVYINENGISAREYLSLLEEKEEDVIDLLSEDFEDEGRYHDIKNPVATTWLISFEQVRQRDPLAADYLSFMACVDAKDIPQSLLPSGTSRKKEIEAIGTLQGYSFIAKGSVDSVITIHRLVHLATRSWLRKEGLLPRWTSRVISRLAEVLSDVGHHNREVWRSYIPHAYYALGPDLGSEGDQKRLDLLWGYGECLDYDGRYYEAEAAYKVVMEARINQLGADHPRTLDHVSNIAIMLLKQGKYEEAEGMNRRALDGREKVLGKDHLDTLISVNNLAIILAEQGKYEEAEGINRRALDGREKVLGKDHPDTLMSVSNLATVLVDQGRYEEAEQMDRQALGGREKVLGKDHPDTLTSVNNLGQVLEKREKYEEAEEMNRRALDSREKVLGKDHPDTLISVNNLAIVLAEQGRYEEAEQMDRQALGGRKKVLGKNHPDTLTSVDNLAIVLAEQGKYEEAEEMNRRALNGYEKVLGKNHPDTLISTDNLAYLYQRQDRLEEADRFYLTALGGFRKVLGPAHPITLACESRYALLRRRFTD